MSESRSLRICPEARFNQLLAATQASDAAGFQDLELLMSEYPEDPRLHFLRGSLLAAHQDYPEAQGAMRRAVELAPGYAVARFQLGLLLLTCGDAPGAQETWGPLHSLPPDHHFRLFVTGLLHMIRDDFPQAIHLLREGISRNQENAPMNRDMEMLIREMTHAEAARNQGGVSSVDLLLQQAALKSSKH